MAPHLFIGKQGCRLATHKSANSTHLHVSSIRVCVEGHIAIASLLVNNGADVNTQDDDWWTPLHAASSAGQWRIANILLSYGALVNIPNADGDFAIDVVSDAKVRVVIIIIVIIII